MKKKTRPAAPDHHAQHQLGYALAVDREVIRCASEGILFPTWVVDVLAKRSRVQLNDIRQKRSESKKKRYQVISAALTATDGNVKEAMDLLEAHYVDSTHDSGDQELLTTDFVPSTSGTPGHSTEWTEENLRKWKGRYLKNTPPDPDALEVFEEYLEKH